MPVHQTTIFFLKAISQEQRMDFTLHFLWNYVKQGTVMSASLAKLTCSVTCAKSICFIQETATDPPNFWLSNPGNGRIRFFFPSGD